MEWKKLSMVMKKWSLKWSMNIERKSEEALLCRWTVCLIRLNTRRRPTIIWRLIIGLRRMSISWRRLNLRRLNRGWRRICQIFSDIDQ